MTSYLLILISLILALLGTFTETFKSKENSQKKELTIWGYIIGLLLLISAGVSIYSECVAETNAKEKALKYEQSLSQQRFLSLLSAGSNFSLANQPILVFEYLYKIDTSGFAADSLYYNKLKCFPGFGIPVDSISFKLAINDSKTFSFNQGNIPIKVQEEKNSGFLIKPQGDSTIGELVFNYEETNVGPDVNYLFFLNGYETVIEALSDFKSERNIGSLSIFKKDMPFSESDKKDIMKMYSNDICFINIYLKKNDTNARLPYIRIPIHFTIASVNDNVMELSLVTQEPYMDSYQFIDD